MGSKTRASDGRATGVRIDRWIYFFATCCAPALNRSDQIKRPPPRRKRAPAVVRTLMELLVAETVLAARRSFFWPLFSVNSLSSSKGELGERTDVIDMILGRRKPETMPENKDDGESDDDDGDEDNEDGEEDDRDEDFSDEEGNEEGEDDDEPDANGEGGSEEEDDDDDDDDDEDDDDDGDEDEDDDEEDDDEEMPQPPPKKKK